MKTNKLFILGMFAALTLGMVSVANATGLILFDPTGTPGAAGDITNVALFDWAPGNALAIGGNPQGGLFTGSSIYLLYQANLTAVQDADTNNLFSNGDGGNRFTAVAGFGETVSGLSGTTANFEADVSQPSFFYIYANNLAANANNLTGAGFTSGQIILMGTLEAKDFDSSFTITNFGLPGQPALPLLDLSPNGNQWGTTTTVRGIGSTNVTMNVNWVDPDYFPELPSDAFIQFSFFNTSQIVPYDQVDPSRAFSSDGIISANFAANIGATNGGLFNNGDYNFIFQADGNQSFQPVPEPTTLLLLGGGLISLVVLKRKKF